MSAKLVALLRGINVGRAKRVAMSDLRATLEELGYTNVRTLLNSGNVVFGAPARAKAAAARAAAAAAARIEEAVAARLGVSSRVIVLTAAELDAAIAANPLLDVADNPSRLLVAVLADPKDRSKLEPLMEQGWDPEVFALGPRVAYVWMPDGVRDTRVLKAVEKALAGGVTSRNWSTMLKLQAMLGD